MYCILFQETIEGLICCTLHIKLYYECVAAAVKGDHQKTAKLSVRMGIGQM